jgi:protein transport protein SEC24
MFVWDQVPKDYLCAVDAYGRRMDMMERAELNQSSIEIIAPSEYMKRPPQPVHFLTLSSTKI